MAWAAAAQSTTGLNVKAPASLPPLGRRGLCAARGAQRLDASRRSLAVRGPSQLDVLIPSEHRRGGMNRHTSAKAPGTHRLEVVARERMQVGDAFAHRERDRPARTRRQDTPIHHRLIAFVRRRFPILTVTLRTASRLGAGTTASRLRGASSP